MNKCAHCDFVITHADKEIQVEKCSICGSVKRYKTVKGKMDNRQYLKDHARDFCQPNGATNAVFQKYYGKK